MNKASGSNLEVGHDFRSCTSDVQLSEEFKVHDRRVVLVDTPGFNDTYIGDSEVLGTIENFLQEL